MAILDVIKYEGDNRTFVWKHPAEDFNTNSQLIVHESQEAHLFLEGRGLDSFGPGRHTLTTQNIPILTSIANLATGGVTPFHAEVWYVNLTEQMGIGWGPPQRCSTWSPLTASRSRLGRQAIWRSPYATGVSSSSSSWVPR